MILQERDIEHQGIRVHLWEGGSGFPLLLLHGTGPGASTLGNFSRLLEPLARRYRVTAMDLIGFGRSGRKSEPPFFDMELWTSQAIAMVDRQGDGVVGIIGHSLSGAIALKTAIARERVSAVLTTGSLGAPCRLNESLERAWTFPRSRDELRQAAEALVYDRSLITEEFLDGRMRTLATPGYAEYFSAMFEGDKQRFIDAARIAPSELAKLECKLLLMHGRDDRPVPCETSIALARLLPQADLMLVSRCGHSPALERSEMLLSAANAIFG